MDRRNDPTPKGAPWRSDPARRDPARGSRWGNAAVPAPRDGGAPVAAGPTLATPFAWMGGSLLLTGTTFLVSAIALIRAIVALFR